MQVQPDRESDRNSEHYFKGAVLRDLSSFFSRFFLSLQEEEEEEKERRKQERRIERIEPIGRADSSLEHSPVLSLE